MTHLASDTPGLALEARGAVLLQAQGGSVVEEGGRGAGVVDPDAQVVLFRA